MHLTRDPRASVDDMQAAGGITGARIVWNVLSSWEGGPGDVAWLLMFDEVTD